MSTNDRFNVVVNARAGGASALGETAIASMLDKSLGRRIGMLSFSSPAEFPDVVNTLATRAPMPFLIGGGDGTAITAADVLKPHHLPFGILPLGTMNLLAQDLGMPGEFSQALPVLKAPMVTDSIDVGIVNDRTFLCSVILGIIPESAVKRERLRENASIETWSELMTTLARGLTVNDPVCMRIVKNDIEAELLSDTIVISNNSYLHAPASPGDRLRRASLKDGHLGVYIASPKSIIDNLRLVFKIWKGTWQEDESIISFETDSFTLLPPEGKVLISIDGEPAVLTSPLHFRIDKRSLPVLVPERRQ